MVNGIIGETEKWISGDIREYSQFGVPQFSMVGSRGTSRTGRFMKNMPK